MMRKWILGGAALVLVTTCAVAQRGQRLPAECRREVVQLCGIDRGKLRECLFEKSDKLSQTCYARLKERADAYLVAAETRRPPRLKAEYGALNGVEHAYGENPLQKLDFHRAKDSDKAPLILFVHGGGWKRGDKNNAIGASKAKHYTGEGYAFASMNYRLVPDATVEQQAADVASAIAYLRRNAAKLGFDPERIVLMGHSAGAHLVALVGTDPQYLRGAGLKPADLSGIIPLDGAAYDVPSQMTDGPRMMNDTYVQAFGADPARQKALSPYWHASAPNAPAFLILHVERDDGARQSEALAEALRRNGAKVKLQAFEGKGLVGHMEINRKLGEPDYPATPVVDAWLREIFAR